MQREQRKSTWTVDVHGTAKTIFEILQVHCCTTSTTRTYCCENLSFASEELKVLESLPSIALGNSAVVNFQRIGNLSRVNGFMNLSRDWSIHVVPILYKYFYIYRYIQKNQRACTGICLCTQLSQEMKASVYALHGFMFKSENVYMNLCRTGISMSMCIFCKYIQKKWTIDNMLEHIHACFAT